MNDNLKDAVLQCIDEKKPLMLSHMAEKFKVSELQVAHALPKEMASFALGTCFDEIWAELCNWEKATFIVQHLGSVIEIKCKINEGKHGHGYFNLMGEDTLGGHFKVDDIKEIAFMSMPFMGLTSLSLQFFNTDGATKFSIYAGRENKIIIPSITTSFDAMREKYSTLDR